MTETTTHFDAELVCVELPDLDSLDISTTGHVRVETWPDSNMMSITIPVDLGALGGEIVITLPRNEIRDHLTGYVGEVNR
ncbi:hypothetical protein [Mycolicibacterium phocaicum]|jgi:hypothetical protein|uniref:hypothetical protein n=1 Tax=Mycolicibacterium phocaicum TaxID=319706 RepID=UPI001CF9FFE4|nr:hypothetical protein [Mycolicibacterium phocaicum]UCZ58679.1 hypothetical protein LHJ73_18050 [Mycolicibacterium phocaicum]